MEELLDYTRLKEELAYFKFRKPFNYSVIDNFFDSTLASNLEDEIIPWDHPEWFFYNNPLEIKKATNNWGLFPPKTYRILNELMSPKFLTILEQLLNQKVYVDPGLHGGGWHIHGPGGNLNPHLDYAIHPKTGLARKLNLIVYLSSEYTTSWGGHLGLWAHDQSANGPGDLMEEVAPYFNRAILFDTTQNSWHGMSRTLVQGDGLYRKSLAIYYLIEPGLSTQSRRERALFAPRDSQKDDESVRKLIAQRADARDFSSAYRTDLPTRS